MSLRLGPGFSKGREQCCWSHMAGSLLAPRPQVQHEARLSMALLDSKADDGFQLLLMTPKPMIRAFDHILQ